MSGEQGVPDEAQVAARVARDRLAGASGPCHRGLYPLIGSSRPAVPNVCG
jgi:hypothetical protein